MIQIDENNEKFREILRKKLKLSKDAEFSTDVSIGAIHPGIGFIKIIDGKKSYLIIRGTFVVGKGYAICTSDIPKEKYLKLLFRNWREQGIVEDDINFVLVGVDASAEAKIIIKEQKIQAIIIPNKKPQKD